MEKKQVPTIVYGKQELIQKKLITQFLVQHNINFSPVPNRNQEYEAVIKISNATPENRERASNLHTGRDSLLSSRSKSPISSRYRYMESSHSTMRSDLTNSPKGLYGLERALNRIIRKDVSPCKSPGRNARSQLMKSVSPIRQHKYPEEPIEKDIIAYKFSNGKDCYDNNEKVTVSPMKKNAERVVTPNSRHVRTITSYNGITAPKSSRVIDEQEAYIEKLCDECIANVQFASEKEKAKIRGLLKAELTIDFSKRDHGNVSQNKSPIQDKKKKNIIENEYGNSGHKPPTKQQNSLQSKKGSVNSIIENYYSFANNNKQQQISKDYKHPQIFTPSDSYENIFLEKNNKNKHENSSKEFLETPSLGGLHSEENYLVSLRYSDTNRQDYLPIGERNDQFEHAEIGDGINSEDIPKQTNRSTKAKLKQNKTPGKSDSRYSKQNPNTSSLDSNLEECLTEEKVVSSERLKKLVEKENFFRNLVSKSVHAFKNQSNKTNEDELEKQTSSANDLNVSFKSSKLKNLAAKKSSMASIDSKTTLPDKQTPALSGIESNIQSRSALFSNCSIDDKPEMSMKNESITSLDGRSDRVQNKVSSKPPIESKKLFEKLVYKDSTSNFSGGQLTNREKSGLFDDCMRINTQGSFDGRKYLSSDESCPTLGIEEYKNMNGHFNSFVKDQVQQIINNGFDSTENLTKNILIIKEESASEEKEFDVYEKVTKNNKQKSSLGTLKDGSIKEQKAQMSCGELYTRGEKQSLKLIKNKSEPKDQGIFDGNADLKYKDSRLAALAKLEEIENGKKRKTVKSGELTQRSKSPFAKTQKV